MYIGYTYVLNYNKGFDKYSINVIVMLVFGNKILKIELKFCFVSNQNFDKLKYQ